MGVVVTRAATEAAKAARRARQQQAAQWLREGVSRAEIAIRLNVSRDTITRYGAESGIPPGKQPEVYRERRDGWPVGQAHLGTCPLRLHKAAADQVCAWIEAGASPEALMLTVMRHRGVHHG